MDTHFESPPTELWDGGPVWLVADAEKLARSASMLDRAACAGLAYRYWRPSWRGRAAVKWAAALVAEDRQQLVRWALDQAECLREELHIVEATLHAHAETAKPQLSNLAWVIRRDDLESVCRLLEVCSIDTCGDQLRRHLVQLDLDIAVYHSMWSLMTGFDSPRLLAFPDVWWSSLAEGVP